MLGVVRRHSDLTQAPLHHRLSVATSHSLARPAPDPCTMAPTLSFRLVSAPALISDSAQSVCSFVTAQCSAVHMDCRDAAAASAQHTQ